MKWIVYTFNKGGKEQRFDTRIVPVVFAGIEDYPMSYTFMPTQFLLYLHVVKCVRGV